LSVGRIEGQALTPGGNDGRWRRGVATPKSQPSARRWLRVLLERFQQKWNHSCGSETRGLKNLEPVF